MEYTINHDKARNMFTTVVDGHTAYVEYRLQKGVLDIIHTIVPRPVEGRGIAAALVKRAYGYALEQGLQRAGTCPYAAKWLERHP
ncbi:GNAT family N-acetyltransferase [Xylanibacter caecicola]|uniref:GNAT family N-acetyltransferase n=1 Tax=Xylanibacter caecicola TaxID=2736294 RepID=UPI00258B0196|nr:GNAT family N-acetyltransferase [Xylanibacter caecicola]